jgi:hypothetical protein
LGADSAGVRAAWTLALTAAVHGDTVQARLLQQRVRGGAVLDRKADDGSAGFAALDSLTIAVLAAARGDVARALAVSASLEDLDVHNRHADPFARTMLHFLRGQWFARLDADSAIAEWRWAENVDWVGWLDGLPQGAEVDWVMRPLAALQRARMGERCQYIDLPLRWWRQADPAIQRLRHEAEQLRTAEACPAR